MVLTHDPESALLALDAVARLDLGCRKDRDDGGEGDHQEGNLFFGKDPFDPFSKILVQGNEKGDAYNELRDKQGQGKVQVKRADRFLMADVWAEVNQERNG